MTNGKKRWRRTVKLLGILPDNSLERDEWLDKFKKILAESLSLPLPQNIYEDD